MTAIDSAAAVVDALHRLDANYMLVGSLSSGIYGVGRMTHDADFVIECEQCSIQQIAQSLAPRFKLDPQACFETVTGALRHILTDTATDLRIDIFELTDDPHNRQRFARRRQSTLAGRAVWVPTAEDVVITLKLRWATRANRQKDRDDILGVLMVQRDRLDFDYIHHWADQHGTRQLLDDIRASIPLI